MFDAATTPTPSHRATPAAWQRPPGGESHRKPAPWQEHVMASEIVPPAVWHWLAAALDELDYGIVLLFDGMNVAHINDAARVELDENHPLQLLGRELRPKLARDVAPLHEAINSAALRGMRRLLTLGKDDQRASVSVIPLEAADAGPRAVLIVLGKRAVCESLSVQGFAKGYGLTGAETRVLIALCNGVPPAQIAIQIGVAVSTIRSQIGSLRLKTGAESIRALVGQVAVLPPVKGALRKNGAARSMTSLLSMRMTAA
ncbi:MAG: helix-turn-helix transcriptional regulator [Caldimonas sp.]